MISIRFIAGCGPSQVLPHTEGVMKKCQKRRQAPGLWHLQGPIWYLGEMTLRTSTAVLCQVAHGVWEGNPTSRASESARSSLSPCRTLQWHHWILKHHDVLTFPTVSPLEMRKMKFQVN